jgi:hypothetical protein
MSRGDQSEASEPPKRIMGTAAMPERRDTTKPLRVRSGETISPDSEANVRYPIRSSPHMSRQFIQRTHSLVRIFPVGSQAPSQCASQHAH